MSVEQMIETAGITCTVQRPTATKDASLSNIETFSTHLANVRLAVQDATGIEAVRYMRETERRLVNVYAKHGTDIRAKDRILAPNPNGTTRTLDVQSSLPREATLRTRHVKVLCEETL